MNNLKDVNVRFRVFYNPSVTKVVLVFHYHCYKTHVLRMHVSSPTLKRVFVANILSDLKFASGHEYFNLHLISFTENFLPETKSR